jgi:hypothetical protein
MLDLQFPEVFFTALIGTFMVALLILSVRETQMRSQGK